LVASAFFNNLLDIFIAAVKRGIKCWILFTSLWPSILDII